MYQESDSRAAKVAREKFEARIELGRQRGAAIIEKIMTEVPTDRVIKGSALRFDGLADDRPVGSPLGMLVGVRSDSTNQHEMSVHDWALQQMCSRAKIPWKYAQYLRSNGHAGMGLPLLANNLNTVYGTSEFEMSKSRYLVRSFNGQARGFLSDRYKRIDSRPLVEAFSGTCQSLGAVPISGHATDTKVGLTAVLPKIYEPVPNEPISFGVHWENSDYGNGRHVVEGFIDRAWCANGCIMSMGFAQVHLGKRLSENMFFSDRTHQLDTMTAASAVVDYVTQILSEDMVNVFCQTVKDAHENRIDVKKALKALDKELSKGESEAIAESFNSPDVEMLPPGNTSWRLSNAISWVAGNSIEDTERSVEMMKIAGRVLEARYRQVASIR